MKYFFIVGERSGDLHASNLIRAIKQGDQEAEVVGVGGELSQAAGMHLIFHYKDMAVMGITQVILKINTIKQNFKRCQQAILDQNIDALVLVDFPGFNLKMAEFAKGQGLKVFYYIAPKVWASRSSRVKKIKAYTDQVFTIFPFENDFFDKHGVNYTYVGNPLLDSLDHRDHKNEARKDFLQRYSLDDRPIIALLAGSRKQEVKKLLPTYLKMQEYYPSYQFILAGVDNINDDYYRIVAKEAPIPTIIYNDTYALLQQAELALVASGTATLETALLRVPQIACYDFGGGWLMYQVYNALVKLKYVTLVNLIFNKEVIKELLQHHFSSKRLRQEMDILLKDAKTRQKMLDDYDDIIEALGGVGASQKTANIIYDYISH